MRCAGKSAELADGIFQRELVLGATYLARMRGKVP